MMQDFYLNPEIQQYSHLELLARQVVEGFITGLHKSPFHGFSVEFAEHRLYNTGESTRHIDWKLFARTEKLFIKSYEEETNLRCQIVIDVSPSMYYPPHPVEENKITFSVYAAAALMELMKRQRDAAGLSIFEEGVKFHYPSRSSQIHRKVLLRELENMLSKTNVEGRTESSVASSIHDIAERLHRRSLVVIFSDMLDSSAGREDIFSALRHLRHNKHEVILFHIHDAKTEKELEFDDRPLRFVDMESGDELKVNPREIRQMYKQKAEDYFNSIALECGHFGIDFIRADTRKGFHQVLYPYLLRRQKSF